MMNPNSTNSQGLLINTVQNVATALWTPDQKAPA